MIMKKNNYYHFLIIAMVALLSFGFESCDKNGDDGLEQTENISAQDPEGTVVVYMIPSSNYNTAIINNLIHIDEANNFEVSGGSGFRLASVGLVGGLGEITQIPASGWAKKVAAIPGTGYVAMNYGLYARIYVVNYTNNGFIVKYQYPFDPSME